MRCITIASTMGGVTAPHASLYQPVTAAAGSRLLPPCLRRQSRVSSAKFLSASQKRDRRHQRRAAPVPRRALEDFPRQVGVQMHREVVDRRLAGGSEIFRPRTVLAIEDAA